MRGCRPEGGCHPQDDPSRTRPDRRRFWGRSADASEPYPEMSTRTPHDRWSTETGRPCRSSDTNAIPNTSSLLRRECLHPISGPGRPGPASPGHPLPARDRSFIPLSTASAILGGTMTNSRHRVQSEADPCAAPLRPEWEIRSPRVSTRGRKRKKRLISMNVAHRSPLEVPGILL